jgi:alpha-1,6-mannosyltransferase
MCAVRRSAGYVRPAGAVSGRWWIAAAVGTVGSGLVVCAAGRLAARNGSVPPSWWGGLARPVAEFEPSPLPAVMIGGVALLLIGWCLLTVLAANGVIGPRRVAAVAALWALPVLIGPPLLSLDVYSYAAHGAMLAAGLDPYGSGPIVMSDTPAARAADPSWLSSTAPYGPLALALSRAVTVVTGGDLLSFVLVMRMVATLSLICVGVCVAAVASPRRRAGALALSVANPIALLQLVGAIHLEAVMMALAAIGLVLAWPRPPAATATATATDTDTLADAVADVVRAPPPPPPPPPAPAPARWRVAVGLVALTAAACVKWPAALIVVAVLVARAGGRRRAGPGRRVRAAAATLAADLVVVLAAFALFSLAVPDGLGWLRSASTPTAGLTLYAPTTGLAFLAAIALTSTGHPYSGLDAVGPARMVGLLAAAVGFVWLLVTHRRRDVAATAGMGLFGLAALGPVVYPWYFMWNVVPLSMSRERARWLLVVPEIVVGSFLALPHCELLFAGHPGFAPWFERRGPLVAVAVLVGAAAVTAVAGRRRIRPAPAAVPDGTVR